MNGLDKLIKAERKRKYKNLRKLRKARDMASKHIKKDMPLSKVYEYFNKRYIETNWHLNTNSTSLLAKEIVDKQRWVFNDFKPPTPPKPVTKKK